MQMMKKTETPTQEGLLQEEPTKKTITKAVMDTQTATKKGKTSVQKWEEIVKASGSVQNSKKNEEKQTNIQHAGIGEGR